MSEAQLIADAIRGAGSTIGFSIVLSVMLYLLVLGLFGDRR
jgi:hypothetical protein